MSEKAEPRFEEALQELEALVERLEGEELPLEEALALFERGQSLLNYCQEQLSAAELKVRELTFEDPGRTTTEGA
jgi:exodeoxyribonuclease VII small subunit